MQWLKPIWLGIQMAFALVILLLLVMPEGPDRSDRDYQLETIVQGQQFDFLVWEVGAIWTKAGAILADNQAYLTEDAQKTAVLHYINLVGQALRLEAEITRTYTDPNIADPTAASALHQAQQTAVRRAIVDLQPLAESIIQQQVAVILAEEGFTRAGRVWPPVMMHMTPLPSILIISERERIERIDQVALANGVRVVTMETLETAVYDQLDDSALVVPIGGLGTYPSMIMETSSLNWLIEVTAHEWGHVWFGVAPISSNYTLNPDVRSMNETAVSILDEEIRDKVLDRYYPELLPPPAPPEVTLPESQTPAEPPPFDFRVEMAKTRLGTDELLAEGKIDEAEEYMEARRLIFLENGFGVRKINQAYFAFYGAYAAAPGGASVSNPVGPMLRDIRTAAPSVKAFMEWMRPMSSFADLEALYLETVGRPYMP